MTIETDDEGDWDYSDVTQFFASLQILGFNANIILFVKNTSSMLKLCRSLQAIKKQESQGIFEEMRLFYKFEYYFF